MSLDRKYLAYPRRAYGMDHARYSWSRLSERPPLRWPGGARLALWINVSVQHFPLNQQGLPFPPPGGMRMPYPDLRHYTLRDYGNRVGVYRVYRKNKRPVGHEQANTDPGILPLACLLVVTLGETRLIFIAFGLYSKSRDV